MIDSRDINVKLRLKYSYSYDENVDGNLRKKKKNGIHAVKTEESF